VNASARRAAGATAAALLVACATGFVQLGTAARGPPFVWTTPTTSFLIQSRGTVDVPDPSARTAVRLAFQSWLRGPMSLGLVEDTGADPSRRDFSSPDVHLVLWDEDGSSGLFPDGSGILALTPVVADSVTGRIVDADIVVNGREFTFSTDARSGAFDVQGVVTHEVGHFLGLDHANGPQSTMFPRIAAGSLAQRFVGRDERAGVFSIYPPDGSRGKAAGSARHANGAPVAWAYVVALDATSGEPSCGATTDDTGAFELKGILPGDYLLYVEPLDGPIHPSDTVRLNGVPADVSFSGTWFPAPITVAAGQEAQAGACIVRDGAGPNPLDARGGVVFAGSDRVQVTITGTGLEGAAQVSVPGAGVTVGSFSRPLPGTLVLDVAVAADAPRGARTVIVTDTSGANGFLTSALLVLDPPPTIGSVTPSVLEAGTLVDIVGTGFAAPSDVVIGGLLASAATVLDSTHVTARAPAQSRAGPLDVVVIRSDGQEARASAAVSYVGDPSLTSVDPARGPIAGGTRHRALGAGFVEPVGVSVGGAAAQVVSVQPTEVDFVLPPAAAPGAVDVAVESGGKTAVLTGGLVYVDAPPLVIDAFDPTQGPTSGGTALAISGRGFENGVLVSLGGVDGVIGSVTSNGILLLTPPHERGAVEVRARDPVTGLEAIAPGLFSYVSAPPPPASMSKSGGGCAVGGDEPGSWLAGVGAVALLAGITLRARRRSTSHRSS
jgi:hypothetical protein